ncbi:hypothetical protein GCM10009855_14410 [Gordonia cholesterolivorans]|uniref:Uncharacterized protein n=1 Tax=Gordonia cholesterolivorans TaxID=559625 RepID=A0ABN3HCU0_9ACTN
MKNPQREPAKASDRVCRGGCCWKRHGDLGEDLQSLHQAIHPSTWSDIRQLMARAARGTVRSTEWEYPCRSSHGRVGELKTSVTEAVQVDDVDDPDTDDGTVDMRVHYRIYYHEPSLHETELWAMAAGSKCKDARYRSTNQDDDIARARDRTDGTPLNGDGLMDMPV